MQPIDQADDPLQGQTPPLGQSLQQGRTQSAPPPGFNPGNLVDSWNKWVDKPNNRAALMQFGIAMLQPMGMGETGTGHFANAIGAAGQAHQHVTEEEQQQQRSDTEAELRQSRAQAAETSANAAETRALYSGQLSNERSTSAALRAQAAIKNAYTNYVSKTNSDNFIKPDAEKTPILNFNEWYAQYGGGLGAEGAGGPEDVTGAGGAVTGPTAETLLSDPRMQTGFRNIQSAIASGDASRITRAKAALQQLTVKMTPDERTRLYSRLGIAP